MNFRYLSLLTMLVIGLSSGCSSTDPEDILAKANDSNIKRLANLYGAYQSRHSWRGPKNEEEFKAFLKAWNSKKLSRIGVDPNAIDDLFFSSRDGEPFKIKYGVPGHVMGSDEPVIFEAEGVAGLRMVGFLNMQQQEVEESEYDQLFNRKIASSRSKNNQSRVREF